MAKSGERPVRRQPPAGPRRARINRHRPARRPGRRHPPGRRRRPALYVIVGLLRKPLLRATRQRRAWREPVPFHCAPPARSGGVDAGGWGRRARWAAALEDGSGLLVAPSAFRRRATTSAEPRAVAPPPGPCLRRGATSTGRSEPPPSVVPTRPPAPPKSARSAGSRGRRARSKALPEFADDDEGECSAARRTPSFESTSVAAGECRRFVRDRGYAGGFVGRAKMAPDVGADRSAGRAPAPARASGRVSS